MSIVHCSLIKSVRHAHLITGVTGFVGGHLVEALLRNGGHTIHGLSRRSQWPSEWSHLSDQVSLHAVDLLDADATERVLRGSSEWIVHLAGYANAGKFIPGTRLGLGGKSSCVATPLRGCGVLQDSASHFVYFNGSGLWRRGGNSQVFREDSSSTPPAPTRPARPLRICWPIR